MSLADIIDRSPLMEPEWKDVENVLPVLARWVREGRSFVLVTLVGIDGSSPRPLGAQMAIAEDGESFGHISGGCLKSEIVNQALSALKTGRNRLLRYGTGSPFMDIVLPCGSGIDLYFDQGFPCSLVRQAETHIAQRRAFILRTDMKNGNSVIEPVPQKNGTTLRTSLNDDILDRYYPPCTRLILMGTDPSLLPLAAMATRADMEIMAYTTDPELRSDMQCEGICARELIHGSNAWQQEIDQWTAVVMLFHDHDREIPLLMDILESRCFFIGVLGSYKTHQARMEKLRQKGVSGNLTERIRGPVGLIPLAKSPVELAVSVLAQIISVARENGARA